MSLHIRTRQPADAIANALVGEIHAIDPGLAPADVISMREQVTRSTSSQRIAVTLLGVFGGLALLLAVVGLYGVMSFAVSQSTRELGLRKALGARGTDLVWLVAAQGVAVTALGIVAGGGAAWLLTRLIATLLYQVGPHDALAFGSAFVIMSVASFTGCVVPTLRAARIDPLRALHNL